VDARRVLDKAYYPHFCSSHCGSLIEMSQYLVNLKRRLQEEALRRPAAECTLLICSLDKNERLMIMEIISHFSPDGLRLRVRTIARGVITSSPSIKARIRILPWYPQSSSGQAWARS
jgi:hypothetical protein